MSMVGYALRMAKKYYDSDTYEHALRVATYVADNDMIPDEDMDNCISLAIMHDLLEDTKYTTSGSGLSKGFTDCLNLLTRPKDKDYVEYIKQIKKNYIDFPEAYWVKLADMKDHLTQTDTLTDKLKEKYLAALPYLL